MGLGDIFNSSTTTGRANVGKATYAFIAGVFLWYKMKKTKPPPPPPKDQKKQSPPSEHGGGNGNSHGGGNGNGHGNGHGNGNGQKHHMEPHSPPEVNPQRFTQNAQYNEPPRRQDPPPPPPPPPPSERPPIPYNQTQNSPPPPSTPSQAHTNIYPQSFEQNMEQPTTESQTYRSDKLLKVEELEPNQKKTSFIDIDQKDQERTSEFNNNAKPAQDSGSNSPSVADHFNLFTF